MKFSLTVRKDAEEEVRAAVHEESEFTSQLESLVRGYAGVSSLRGYREDEAKILPLAEIECISVLDGKCRAIDSRGDEYVLKARLYELEEQLPGNFIRINKSALANRDRIDRLTASFSGAVDVVFRCGCRDYVSRRCLKELKRRLGIQ